MQKRKTNLSCFMGAAVDQPLLDDLKGLETVTCFEGLYMRATMVTTRATVHPTCHNVVQEGRKGAGVSTGKQHPSAYYVYFSITTH